MVNNSRSDIVFQWEKVSSSYILEVEPPVGELGSRCELELDLCISGQYPGKIEHKLLCYVQHMSHPLTLSVQANIKVIHTYSPSSLTLLYQCQYCKIPFHAGSRSCY